MASADNSGLDVFDEAASAVGGFPTALRGYDRAAVDDYVRTLETTLRANRRRVRELDERVGSLEQVIEENRQAQIDYADLGARAAELLRLAQEQARELTDNATTDAERTRELGRREADAIRREARQQGERIRAEGVAERDALRARLRQDLQDQLERAKAEAEALVAAARRQADAVRQQGGHDAQTVRQAAHLETEELRRTLERETAEARAGIARMREQAVADLRAAHEQAEQQTAALLAEATEQHAEAGRRLEADLAEAARLRAEALAEAEATKAAAAEEAERRLAGAREEAATITARTAAEFSWRKQQLQRETTLLNQRKQAVLGQLAGLSALAQQTASTFPDLEELDLDTDEVPLPPLERPGSDPGDGADQPEAPAAPQRAAEEPAAGVPAPAEPDRAGRPDEGLAEPDLDGDATIVLDPGQLPAGTEHLPRPAAEGGPRPR